MKFEKKKVIFISAAAALFVLFLTFFIVRLCIPRVRYEVRLADALYEQYVTEENTKELPFVLLPESEASVATGSFFATAGVTVASIRIENNLTLLPQQTDENEICYPLSERAILPCVPADFSSKAMSVLDPKLQLSFYDDSDIPKGWRALPVDGHYAGEEDYVLSVTKSAVVKVFVHQEKIEKALLSWCEKTFVFEENALSYSSAKGPMFIASVGDIMVARGAQEILMNYNDGLERVFGTTLPLLQKSDFTIGNLEGVVTDSWNNATKTYTFKFKKAVLPYLMKAGFDYLMQTNNHCYDYGESGFKDTLKAFAEYNIPSSGIGYNAEEALKFYHTTVKGVPLAVISCGAFPVEQSGFDGKKTATATETRAGILWKSDELLAQVRKEKEAGNVVIVNVHGGEEYRFVPSKSQREFYEALCDNGASVVFGSHPHVLQPTEWYKESLIVYSMGNFVFNGMDGMYGATDSEVVRVGFLGNKIAYVEQYPAVLTGASVTLK